MNVDVAQAILSDRRMAYAVTDRDLVVVEIRDPLGLLAGGQPARVGCSLLEMAPELIGSEHDLAAVLNGESPRCRLEWINRERAGDETIYLAITNLPYPQHTFQAGSPPIAGLIHVVEDMTTTGALQQGLMQHRNELRLAQEELARRNLELNTVNAELRRLDDMKSTFVSIAAHELRTPLTAIKGYVEMLLDGTLGGLSERQMDSLEVVERSSDRLLRITNNLLDVTRIESGRVELVLQPEDVVDLAAAVVRELKPTIDAKQHQVELRIAPGIPPILCDRMRAAQILGNLLSNAIKYTPDGGRIVISAGLATRSGYVQIAVADNGIGIGAEDQNNLFTRFFRADTAYLVNASGAGLGLFITQSLVELHGGEIWFESQEGQGSTFYAIFSAADVEEVIEASTLPAYQSSLA